MEPDTDRPDKSQFVLGKGCYSNVPTLALFSDDKSIWLGPIPFPMAQVVSMNFLFAAVVGGMLCLVCSKTEIETMAWVSISSIGFFTCIGYTVLMVLKFRAAHLRGDVFIYN